MGEHAGTDAGHGLAEPRNRCHHHRGRSEKDRADGPCGLKKRVPSQWFVTGNREDIVMGQAADRDVPAPAADKAAACYPVLSFRCACDQ
jgi:hypothetical protein